MGWNARKGEEGRFKAGIHRRDETLYTIILGRGKPLNNKVLESEREERNMKNLKNKLKKQGGFTLVEMLTVVAIIAILIAISIPMVTGALDRAKKATDAANVRAAKAIMSVEYLTEKTAKEVVKVYDAEKGILVDDLSDITAYSKEKKDEVICVVTYDNVVYYRWVAQTGSKPDAPTSTPDDSSDWKTEVPVLS